MTTPQPEEQGQTAPVELPLVSPDEHPVQTSPVEPPPRVDAADGKEVASATTRMAVAHAATPAQQEVLFVPLAVSVGDGFKFGCGFFLAMVIAGLVAFVLLAALFVLTGLLGLNVPPAP